MISREVLQRIRHDQRTLLRTIESMLERSGRRASGGVHDELEELRRALREHIGLINAVLDAVSEDDVEPLP
jgi:ElaB/YqjD/DUF883 family membrane-anchored ribosome-binding protein